MAEITYEVLVLQAGKWTIESRYSQAEREDAINDAKSMHENPHVKAVKVVKETYDPATGENYDSTVFSTEAAKPAIGGRNFADMEVTVGTPDYAEMSFGAGGFGDTGQAGASAKEEKEKKKSKPIGKNPIAMIFLKILFITAVSLGFAFFVGYIFSGGLHN